MPCGQLVSCGVDELSGWILLLLVKLNYENVVYSHYTNTINMNE